MNILVRAVITGFGLKLGSEVAKRIAERFSRDEDADAKEEKRDSAEEDDMMPSELTTDGPAA
ncbi:MAG: hypothetical protein B7733_24580 [Myxococcales bacterium FL481]|nr:MAG: hypothetical protein B7733_24580 [Myxococcales bacterium FL481]